MRLVPSRDPRERRRPTAVCVIRATARDDGLTMLSVSTTLDVESGHAGPSHTFTDSEDALSAVSDFLRQAGGTFRTNQSHKPAQ